MSMSLDKSKQKNGKVFVTIFVQNHFKLIDFDCSRCHCRKFIVDSKNKNQIKVRKRKKLVNTGSETSNERERQGPYLFASFTTKI